jgi:hypothetical protein
MVKVRTSEVRLLGIAKEFFMHCSGCGKDIPFAGDVCPYCNRDNTADKQYVVMGFMFSVPALVAGYWIFDSVVAAIVGFVGGCVLAFFASGKNKKTDAPEVQVVDQGSKESTSNAAERMKALKSMLDDGLITDEEYKEKKESIMSEI